MAKRLLAAELPPLHTIPHEEWYNQQNPKLIGRVCMCCGTPLTPYTGSRFCRQAACFHCEGRVCRHRQKNGKICGRETSERGEPCGRHGGSKLYISELMSPHTRFTPELHTDAKKLVRADLYRSIMKENLRCKTFRKDLSFLVLPGEHPSPEFDSIRTACALSGVTPHISAFDRSYSACKAALACGADLAIYGDLYNLNCHDALESIRYRNYDVINLDLCSTLDRTLVTYNLNGSNLIGRVAKRAQSFIVTFVSYGMDDSKTYEREAEEWLYFGSIRHQREQTEPDRIEKILFQLQKPLLGRILMIRQSMRDGLWFPVRIYLYRGHRMPMLGVVLARWWADPWDPYVVKVKNSDLRDRVLQESRTLDVHTLSKLYDVPVARIAAWKAVRTMQLKERTEEPANVLEFAACSNREGIA